MKLEDEIMQPHFGDAFQKLAVNLMFTGSWLNAHNVKALKPHGLSPQQFNILRILRGQHPRRVTVQLIKERMLDRMSNVSRLVEKLRVKGLLERHTCQDDRRAVDVWITPKGLDLLKELDGLTTAAHTLFDMLTETEAHQLNLLLDKLRG